MNEVGYSYSQETFLLRLLPHTGTYKFIAHLQKAKNHDSGIGVERGHNKEIQPATGSYVRLLPPPLNQTSRTGPIAFPKGGFNCENIKSVGMCE